MKCDEIKERLYDFIKGSLSEAEAVNVKGHIADCENCKKLISEMKQTVNLLDTVKPPPLSSDFRNRVMKRIQDIPLPSRSVSQRIKELFQMPSVKWPLEGLAVAAVILIAVTIYLVYTPGKMDKPEIDYRDIKISLSDVRNPIIVESNNIENSLERLKQLIYAHNGKVLQTIMIEQGMKVTFSLEAKEETALFVEINKMGNARIENEGFRDTEGNIVVVLVRKK